jgi:hypothetical protein
MTINTKIKCPKCGKDNVAFNMTFKKFSKIAGSAGFPNLCDLCNVECKMKNCYLMENNPLRRKG